VTGPTLSDSNDHHNDPECRAALRLVTGARPVHSDGEMVRDTDIRWVPDPLPRLELLPLDTLVAFDHTELLEYTFDLQGELQSVRCLLHESLGALTRVTVQRDQLKQTVVRLHDALRQQRSSL
jgi:hypothetical protein